MDSINQIISHPLWQENMQKIRELEQTRIFCRHDADHLLDVARLAYIENLEQNLGISRERIYGAALLHDLGRAKQYEDGTPHDIAGGELAEKILKDCGFSDEDRREIVEAISGHRNTQTGENEGLSGLLYRADKASRQCLFCSARKDCNWSDEKKNLILKR